MLVEMKSEFVWVSWSFKPEVFWVSLERCLSRFKSGLAEIRICFGEFGVVLAEL